MHITEESIANFQSRVWKHYHDHARILPWRLAQADGSFDSYAILVSEYMLQQTQVPRVVPKYEQFIAKFPTVTTLAEASLAEVLTLWSGLGYNRRAKYIHAAAKEIAVVHNGQVPDSVAELVRLPGIGSNTAAAILAYSFNMPVVFIETNIRTVYIHHFFSEEERVSDQAILQLVQQTVDAQNPREWYWALMDYGTVLKTTNPGIHQKSTHFKKQSAFHGSKRKVRGEVIRFLTTGAKTKEQVRQQVQDSRLEEVLQDLTREELVVYQTDTYQLAS